MVTYFMREEMPGQQFFGCTRLSATLSVSSCASMWKQGNQGNVERFGRCKTCPIGATHAGETQASESALMGKTICGRCHHGASRLILKHLCVSCYNRQREFVLGKNSKGSRPIKLAPLCRRRIRFITEGTVQSFTLEHSRDMAEMVVSVLRDQKKRVQFAFMGMPGGVRQGRLF